MSNLQQQKVEWTPEMQQKADRLRPRRTFADDLSEFTVTNPVARAYGLMYQGVSNAGLNPLGHLARAGGLDTRPLEPRNIFESATELLPMDYYDVNIMKGLGQQTAAHLPLKSWGLTGRKRAGAGWGQKLGRKTIKIAKAALTPETSTLLAQDVNGIIMGDLIQPQTEWGKFGTTLLSNSLVPGSNPLNLFRTIWQTAPATVAKKGVMGALKKGVKRLPKNRYARDFFEDDFIGEGAKSLLPNLLAPNVQSNQNPEPAEHSSAAARLYAGGSTNFGQYPAAENESPFDQMCYGQSLMPRDYAPPYASTTALYPRYPSARQAAFDTFLRFNQRGK